MNFRILFLFFIILFFNSACTKNNNSIDINSWEILQDKCDSFESVKEKNNWKKISDVEMINIPYEPDDFYNGLWIKSTFFIDKDPDEYYGLSLKEFDLSGKIYINNYLLFSRDLYEIGNLDEPVNCIIPQNTLKKGTNEIYIYLVSFIKWPHGITNKLLIQPKEEFRLTKIKYDFFSEMIPIGIFCIFIGSMISFLIKFVIMRFEKEYLFMALRIFIALLYMTVMYSPFRPFGMKMTFETLLALVPLSTVFFYMYYQSVYGIYFNLLNRIFSSILFIMASLCMILPFFIDFTIPSAFFYVVFFIILSFYDIYILLRMHSIKHNWFKFIHIATEILVMIIVHISMLIFVLTKYGGFNDPSFVILIGSVIIAINSIIYYSRRDRKRKDKMESLFNKMQKIDKSKKVSITENNEEKMDRLVRFINENYHEYITREDLAEAVGLNANYLSSLFNAYTGKKITEYINEVRINAASEKLRNSEDKIIDIAFDVGFESLSTFNRVFKNLTEKTPSECRANS